jgi:hypothetical protein
MTSLSRIQKSDTASIVLDNFFARSIAYHLAHE